MKTLVSLIFLLIVSAQVACSKMINTQPSDSHLDEKSAILYLALGDSYTIGEGVSESDRWPVQLAALLNQAGLATEKPRIIARTGWTTDELMAAINQQQPADTFNLVSLLIGVNNQYRGRPVTQFRIELIQLINKAISFAGGDTSRVFLVSIPDWGVTPFAAGRDRAKIGREIDEFNEVIRQEAVARNILFFNITNVSRLAASDASLLASDQLHPSGKMYRLWVEMMLPEIRALFKGHE
ncbi:MAG TPA: SGNH/GDSL hydrolase family protein [Bacteroidales bacterium]|nr:SGNH/GDSL hydrolase family protein [Bacteroidales bacterium]